MPQVLCGNDYAHKGHLRNTWTFMCLWASRGYTKFQAATLGTGRGLHTNPGVNMAQDTPLFYFQMLLTQAHHALVLSRVKTSEVFPSTLFLTVCWLSPVHGPPQYFFHLYHPRPCNGFQAPLASDVHTLSPSLTSLLIARLLDAPSSPLKLLGLRN